MPQVLLNVQALSDHKVLLEGTLLKPNMVSAGQQYKLYLALDSQGAPCTHQNENVFVGFCAVLGNQGAAPCVGCLSVRADGAV